MKAVIMLSVMALGIAGSASASAPKPHMLHPVPIQQVKVNDPFWSPKIERWLDVTIPDCFDKFEKDGTLDNYDAIRDGRLSGPHRGDPWHDGLLYEMIRGCADFLAQKRDPELEARLDGYIDRVAAAAAKDPDGYINTYTQVEKPKQRFGMNGGDDRWQHDIYNSGCLVEAAVHYYRATGKTKLLHVATRMVNYMCATIGTKPKHNVIPGHSITEEALVGLYNLYREQPALKARVGAPVHEADYLRLAEFFIEARGHYEGRNSFDAYGQDHMPVFQQPTIEGHAVRATLMGAGVTAIAMANHRSEYYETASRLWENMVNRKLYITGGVGATAEGEAFGPDYVLPNTGYLETCAAVGNGFYSHEMNLAFGQSKYVDQLELVLYNGALCHVSEIGNTYSYVNPLTFHTNHARWPWHSCPCCPPMFAKIMGALPGYIYAQDDTGLYVNLFVGNSASINLAGHKVAVTQTTRYPWDGGVDMTVSPEKAQAFDLYIRVPAWCQQTQTTETLYQVSGLPTTGAFKVAVNGQPIQRLTYDRGYARIHRVWAKGDRVEIRMDMPVRRVRSPKVTTNTGFVALKRGPVVYAIEPGADYPAVDSLYLPQNAKVTAQYRAGVLGGVTVVKCEMRKRQAQGYVRAQQVAIPYYAYLNRGASEFRVWVPEDVDKAAQVTLAASAKATSSHVYSGDPLDSLRAISDGVVPSKSSDAGSSRASWWDHKGTSEWVQYDFALPTKLSSAKVYWFADKPAGGGCDVPQSWRVLYLDGAEWKPVQALGAYGVMPDQYNEVKFAPVTATSFRLEARLQPNVSAGLCEWYVE